MTCAVDWALKANYLSTAAGFSQGKVTLVSHGWNNKVYSNAQQQKQQQMYLIVNTEIGWNETKNYSVPSCLFTHIEQMQSMLFFFGGVSTELCQIFKFNDEISCTTPSPPLTEKLFKIKH